MFPWIMECLAGGLRGAKDSAAGRGARPLRWSRTQGSIAGSIPGPPPRPVVLLSRLMPLARPIPRARPPPPPPPRVRVRVRLRLRLHRRGLRCHALRDRLGHRRRPLRGPALDPGRPAQGRVLHHGDAGHGRETGCTRSTASERAPTSSTRAARPARTTTWATAGTTSRAALRLWLRGEDADRLVVITGLEIFSGLNLQLDVLGGLDGTVTGALLVGQQVRAESTSDARMHHNDFHKDAPHLGEYSFRGSLPAASRCSRTIRSSARTTRPSRRRGRIERRRAGPALEPARAARGRLRGRAPPQRHLRDRGQPRLLGACSGASGGRCFGAPAQRVRLRLAGPHPLPRAHQPSAAPATSTSTAGAGSREIATSSPQGAPARQGGGIESPWLDPTVSFWFAGAQLLADDDSLGGGYRSAAFLDTTGRRLASDGRTCVAVSSFGDVAFSGQGNQSGGRYQLLVELGNRQPAIAATPSVDGGGEGDPGGHGRGAGARRGLAFSDPDSAPDSLSLTVRHTDKNGAPVAAARSPGRAAPRAGCGRPRRPRPT